MKNDTIVALATPAFPSAVCLVRMSGPEAFSIANKIFHHKKNLKDTPFKHFRIYYGQLGSGNDIVDEVLLHSMKAPHTYTGEDNIEITAHGSIIIQKRILDLLIKSGARMAEPGEFTKRAFINGKIDLIEAEAVNDLINASSEYACKTALAQLQGSLSKKLLSLKEKLLNIVSYIEASLDFPEEDTEDSRDILKELGECEKEISSLLSSARYRHFYWEGIRCSIIGPVNVGKSSLFNALCTEERAIVTEYPGTTRDFLEANINLEGIQIKLIDTAGLRESNDEIEKIGIQRSKNILAGSEIVILVSDATDSKTKFNIPEEISGKLVIRVMNKVDLLESLEFEYFDPGIFLVSAKTGMGIEDLVKGIHKQIMTHFNINEESSISVNSRQKLELEAAKECLSQSIKLLSENYPLDVICDEVKKSLFRLKSVVGEVTSSDVLDNIFSNFCIGK